MTRQPTVKSRDLTTVQPFLMPWPQPGPPDDAFPDRRSPSEGKPDIAALTAAFPDRPVGNAFIDAALAAVRSEKTFAAVAARIDSMPGKAMDNTEDGHDPIEAARVASTVIEARGGRWSFIESDLIGCVFPGADGEDGDRAAQIIRDSVERLGIGTVTTGVAVFPFHDFTPRQTIRNAEKAVHHAAFFGPGSSARFDAVSLNVSGDMLYQRGEVDAALAEFQTALALDPENANVQNSLGVCYGIRKEYDQALAAFEAAITADPSEFTAVYNAGLVHLLMNSPEKAMEYFERAAPQGEDVFEIQFQTGKLLVELGREEDAVPYLEKAAALEPESSQPHRLLGEIQDRLGNQQSALAHLKRAVRINPFDAASLSSLGRLYSDQGENIDICITFCRQSVEIDPRIGLYHLRLAELYRKAGKQSEALNAFRRARDLGTNCEKEIAEIELDTAREAS